MILTNINFRHFRTQNNHNTLPRKKIPLDLCKISSVLAVPLLLLLCGAAWLINVLDSFKHPWLFPLQGDPREPACFSWQSEDEPTHRDGQSLLHTSLGRQQKDKTSTDGEAAGWGTFSWHGRLTAMRTVGQRTAQSPQKISCGCPIACIGSENGVKRLSLCLQQADTCTHQERKNSFTGIITKSTSGHHNPLLVQSMASTQEL